MSVANVIGDSMSRVHKYRAWDEETKHMIYLSDINKEDYCLALTLEGYLIDIAFDRHMDGDILNKKFELMQFTGLLDKNDKEIYEGDIVIGEPPYYMEKVKGVVKYCGIGFAFVGKTESRKEWFDTTTNHNIKKADVKVIGNRFENPEYLEE